MDIPENEKENARPGEEGSHMRTLEEIEACGKDMLIPQDVSGYLGCKPYSINLQARDDPASLGFPVIMMGNRVRIPREGFVRFCRGLEAEA